MKMLAWALMALVVFLAGTAVYVRWAPSDPSAWNADPLTVAAPSKANHFLMHPDGGDSAGEIYEVTPEALLAAFDKIARAAPRTIVLAGTTATGQITYITRSALWGFPDYTTVRAVPDENGARLAIFARSRFGKSDLGVNRARIEDWLSKLDLKGAKG